MSLLTLERSSPSPHESENEDVLSTSSYEGFVARDHYAMCLSPRPYTSLGPGSSGDSLRIFAHLKKLVKLLRTPDKLRMAVELENSSGRKVTKYLVIVTTNGYMGTEETVVLGTEQEGSTVRICLVLPLWRDTEIKLDGDGGFSVHTGDRHQVFKPSSVQSMWAALQMMYKATKDAQANNYYVGGLSHTWMSCYKVLLTTDGAILNEWNLMEDVESFRPDSPIYGSDVGNSVRGQERVALEKILTFKLREVMLHQDLEVVTCKQLRMLLEKEMNMDLKEYRGFLDQQMLRILGQMERPSQIFDYLYLGSEWNASNLPELKELGVKYIVNISREIDNFYPEEFKYLNIRLYDLPNSELMKHWDKTYTFLKEAKTCGKAVLVHCKMGISRSAATVVAYTMKEYKMSLSDALKHVKEKRNIVNPNEGFLSQLQAYEGILKARHNELWGKMAPSRPIPTKAIGLYRARSRSEPNIPELFNNVKNMEEGEPELSFLEEGGGHPAGDTSLLHVSSNHLDQEGKGPPGSPLLSSLKFPPQSTPVDKTENIRHFLASLPNVTVEDDQGLGDNMCTSESGSGYSSPISTPTDDDHLHSRYNKLAKEIRREHRATSEQQQQPKPLREEEEEREREEGAGGETDGDVCQRDESKELEASSQEKAVDHVPTSVHEKPPSMCESESSRAVSSHHEDTHDPTDLTALAERFQPIAQIPVFQGIPKPLRSTSLPRNIISQYQTEKPTFHDYPRLAVSGSPDAMSESLMAEHGSTSLSVSESNFEASLSPSEQAKVTKLDVPNTSGLIQLPQIQSVPERIKEIEEMNSLKGSSKSPTVPPLDGGGSQPSERKEKCEFFIPEDTTTNNRESAASITRTSSGHSITSSLSVGDEDLKQLTLLNDNSNSNDGKALHMIPARHSSLSPNTAPLLPRADSDMHVRTASCCLLPSSSEALVNSDSPPPLESGNKLVTELVQLGSGAVKARVLDIERNRDERSASSDELSLRRQSPPFQQRAASTIGVMIPEAIMSSSEARDLKQLILAQQRRPSSEIVQECMSPGAHHRRETTPPAFLSAWSKLVDEIPTMPVQDLKKKFEDSDAVSVGSSIGSARPHQEVKRSKSGLRRSQSLRAVDSPGKVRHRFKGLKKLYSNQSGPGGRVCGGRTASPCSQD